MAFCIKVSDICSLDVVGKDGVMMSFTEWFKDVAGVDLSKDFTFTFMDQMTYEEVSGVFPGRPYFSSNGKSLMFSGMNPENGDFIASVYCFDNNIFETVPTGIKVNVVNSVVFNGTSLNIGEGVQGVAEVFTMDGAKCGSFVVNGKIDFKSVLGSGSYVVKTSVAGKSPVSLKICIK